ncbi:MAG TPA: GNAT family N-acetyltransferase [Terriglobales bacterium]|jgi:ribosomal protein S18 acetylase RimI-like enzyme
MQLDGIALRQCTVDHASTLALIGAATFLEAFAGTLDGASIVAHCHKQHAADVYTKYLSHPETRAELAVAEPGEAPVGYSLLTAPDLPLPDLNADDIELKRIYLLSRFQGNGRGNALMEGALRAARAMGKKRILLGVYARNAKALAFYRKHGFAQVGTRTFQVGASVFHDLVLGRAL